MSKHRSLQLAAVAAGTFGLVGIALAHHSFAMFDLERHKVVEGHVTAWNYNNPHSWLHIESTGEHGRIEKWSFEGAAPVHAARQGVNGRTFAKGERVKVVMSPLRDNRNAGAICFVVKEDGTLARPNDGICNSEAVIAEWQKNGWIESTKHLEERPAVGR